MGYETNSAYEKNSYTLDYKVPGTIPPPGQLPNYWVVWTTQPGFIENAPYSRASGGRFSIAFRYTRSGANSGFATYNDARTNLSFNVGFTATASNYSVFFPDGTLKSPTVGVSDSNVTNRWSYLTFDGAAGGTNDIKIYGAGFSLVATKNVSGWTPFLSTRDWNISVSGSLLVAIWTNYVLTSSDATSLEAGWEPS